MCCIVSPWHMAHLGRFIKVTSPFTVAVHPVWESIQLEAQLEFRCSLKASRETFGKDDRPFRALAFLLKRGKAFHIAMKAGNYHPTPLCPKLAQPLKVGLLKGK